MVVDASSLLAILLGAERAPLLLDALVQSPVRRMSAATWFELATTIEERGGRIASIRFDEFIRASGIEIVAFCPAQAEAARTAWRHFGLSRHPDRLGPVECTAYALAKTTGDCLLFDGAGFARTDIAAAVPPS